MFINNLKSWKISFCFSDPISSLKIEGNNFLVKNHKKQKNIFFKENKSKFFIKIFSKKSEIYTFPAYLNIYYRIVSDSIYISNIASELFNYNESILLNNSTFIQNLCGLNYPNDNLFNEIKLFESSSFYNFNSKGKFIINSSIIFKKKSSLDNVYSKLMSNTENCFNSNKPVAVLISGGYDSRLNLVLILELQKKYNFKIYLFHEYKDEKEYKIAKKIADSTGLEFECFDRDFFKKESLKIIFNDKFIDYNSGIYRDNVPRWICYLSYIKLKIPNVIIFGHGVEAHKGKYYNLIKDKYELRESFGNSINRIKFIAKYLKIDIDDKFEKSYFNCLLKRSEIFSNLNSKIDFVHYHTYCSNGYKKRCNVFKLLNIPFPFIEDSFLSLVFSLNKKEKEGFLIVKNLIKKINPQLHKIKYISANSNSLKKSTFSIKSLLKNTKLMYFMYHFKHPKRKGNSFLDKDLFNQIRNDKPKSSIVIILHNFLLSKKYIPIVRVNYVFQMYSYLRTLEKNKNIIFKTK